MKNIISIYIVFSIFTYGIQAQNENSDFRIGLVTSFEINTSSKYVSFDQYTGYSADYDKFNYRIGLNFEYSLTENISINSALNYSNKDFTGTYYCAVCDFIAPINPKNIDFRFIEVPLTIKYYFLPNNIKLFGVLGFNNLFLLNREVTDYSYGLGIKLGGGIEYELSKKIAMQIILDYNSAISNFYKESDFKLKSMDVGIGIMKRL